MDKETLSNYGWIVIAVLVLVVMIALASPFGQFVSQAVQSTTKGLFDVNKSALDSTGLINIDNQEFDVPDMNHGAENGGNVGETPVVPDESGMYYLSGKWTFKENAQQVPNYGTIVQSINFTSNGKSYTSIEVTGGTSNIDALYRLPDGTPDMIYGALLEPDFESGGKVWTTLWWGDFKVVDFGLNNQTVSEEFYEWFTSSASKATESEPETPTLITFKIDGKSYQAEEGMTWAQWIESEYTGSNSRQYFTIISNSIHIVIDVGMGPESEGSIAYKVNLGDNTIDFIDVLPTDVIEASKEYTT